MAQHRTLYPLTGPIRPYDWGSTTAIAELLGREPDGTPQAEMWFGAHPGAPATVQLAGRAQGLDTLVAERPELLGASAELPFLMKLLAAGRPLSLQVHPTREQAAAGYAREDAAGLALSDPTRSYKDVNHKPEIIIAISPFRALCGFREPAASGAALLGLLGDAAAEPAAGRLLAALALPEATAALQAALVAILTPDAGMDAVAAAVVARAAEAEPSPDTETVALVADAYGADPGVLVALLLNRVDLAPGEALFLDAGHLHAYLSGLGLEAMATSDNVLRGGLTTKHVDVPGLVEIVRFTPLRPHRIEPVTSTEGGVTVAAYRVPVPDFAVLAIEVDGGSRTLADVTGPAVLVVTEGELTASVGAETLTVGRGRAAFQASGGPLRVGGTGRGYLTTTG